MHGFRRVALLRAQAAMQFRSEGTTGDVSIMPYTMMVANGTLWFTYGALLSNPTIMLPNITAIVLGSGYVATFLKYRSPQVRPLAPSPNSPAPGPPRRRRRRRRCHRPHR
jgi:hypothetical protein